MKNTTISILGTDYTFEVRKYRQDATFELCNMDGYHDGPTKLMVVCDLATHPSYRFESSAHKASAMKEIARHEVVHAFLFQSGLAESCLEYGKGWATNEEMVDWFALQGPKIYAAWKQINAI